MAVCVKYATYTKSKEFVFNFVASKLSGLTPNCMRLWLWVLNAWHHNLCAIWRPDEVQTFCKKPEKWAFEVCLERVSMTSHSDAHVQVNVYLNLPYYNAIIFVVIWRNKSCAHICSGPISQISQWLSLRSTRFTTQGTLIYNVIFYVISLVAFSQPTLPETAASSLILMSSCGVVYKYWDRSRSSHGFLICIL